MTVTPASAPNAAPDPPSARPAGPVDVTGSWWVVGISSIIGIVIGVLVVAYPDPSIRLLGVFLGIDLVIGAVLLIMRGASKDAGDEAPFALLMGVLSLLAGLIVIRNPRESLVLLVLAFAIWAIVFGAVSLGRGLVRHERRWTRLLRGLLLVAAGTVIISWPDITGDTLAILAGITLILNGFIGLAEAAVLRALRPSPAEG